MGLPTRNLDDRTFQSIVDEAKKRIAASSPGWTDHNVSDPGVTLVELFAWMTEMILYRMNQVPEKNYIKFMELLGLKLQEAEPARVPATFYLSSPQSSAVTIPAGTELSTVRTETQPAIVFSTDETLAVHPPETSALLTRVISGKEGKASFKAQNLKQLGVSGFQFNVFGSTPTEGDALYLGFENDLSQHVLALDIQCAEAQALGIDVDNPPWEWEGWVGGDERWGPLAVERDGTLGMNKSGRLVLRLPRLAQHEIQNTRGYWIRCRVVEPQMAGTNYEASPVVQDLKVHSLGGTTSSTHASIVQREIIGRSDGSPGQQFFLEYTPLLRRQEGETLELRVSDEDGWQAWEEVEDFADSQSDDRHFTLDSASGELRFGPALRHPDGTVRAYGALPPRGAELRFSAYRHGGGVVGNVRRGALTVVKSSIPYVDSVTNHQNATGGVDPETIDLAQMRAPQLLRTRGRAVTPEDYEALALEADSRVARARCIQPEPGGADPGPGQIFLMLVPKVYHAEGFLSPDQLDVGDELRKRVLEFVDEYRLLTVRVDVRQPEFVWVGVELTVNASPESDPERVRADVERRLYHYFNPVTGGPERKGWPFGRDLYPSEVYAALQGVRGLEFIEDLKLFLAPPGGNEKEVSGRVSVPVHGLVASAQHRVKVR